ncbi:hypothetical protein H4N54_24380 [Limnospira fusiformis KN01]|uniref:hypothetical protein n=1 Tax=Limnospira fusiformis TaxID=54297 RepID=UPI00144A292E|nr:hypothetical protein [Limnospira fusiformis]QJB29053.1 hypothetical protein HFV01_28665 [Limnospira fusiformis SAG 85.79]ULB45488.1 hypothetical protein H4N54_24380 [Limnospira fusiformis KN01]
MKLNRYLINPVSAITFASSPKSASETPFLNPSTHPPPQLSSSWLVRSLYTTQSDSSRLAGAIAKPNTVG